MGQSAKSLYSEDSPSLYSYNDYRVYLLDLIAFRKKTEKKFSFRSLSIELGITHAYLSQILGGKRRMQDDILSGLIEVLGFSKEAEKYFKLLVVLSDSPSQEERDKAFRLVQKFSKFQKQSPKEFETYKYLSHWYFVAIRELAQLQDFQADTKWIKSKLAHKVSSTKIKEALDFLIKHEFIAESSSGKYFLPDKEVYCEQGAFKLSLGQFHREMLSLTADSINTVDADKRQILGFTLAIPNSQVDEIKAILDRAQKEIANLESREGKATDVYHVTLAAVPLAGGKK